jgi:hypothetical protein
LARVENSSVADGWVMGSAAIAATTCGRHVPVPANATNAAQGFSRAHANALLANERAASAATRSSGSSTSGANFCGSSAALAQVARTSHEESLTVPVFDNSQDIAELADRVDAWLDAHATTRCFGYLIRGHGIYAWGDSMATCMRHLEAFDYLFHIELERRRLSPDVR